MYPEQTCTQKDPRRLMERRLLGATLLDSRYVPLVLESLTPKHFSAPEHRLVFQSIEALYTARPPIDPITVAAQLARAEAPSPQGGWNDFLRLLVEETPSADGLPLSIQYLQDQPTEGGDPAPR